MSVTLEWRNASDVELYGVQYGAQLSVNRVRRLNMDMLGKFPVQRASNTEISVCCC